MIWTWKWGLSEPEPSLWSRLGLTKQTAAPADRCPGCPALLTICLPFSLSLSLSLSLSFNPRFTCQLTSLSHPSSLIPTRRLIHSHPSAALTHTHAVTRTQNYLSVSVSVSRSLALSPLCLFSCLHLDQADIVIALMHIAFPLDTHTMCHPDKPLYISDKPGMCV